MPYFAVLCRRMPHYAVICRRMPYDVTRNLTPGLSTAFGVGCVYMCELLLGRFTFCDEGFASVLQSMTGEQRLHTMSF